MKNLISLLLISLSTTALYAQTTDIWIVRHAEKEKANPQEKDPDLSVEGEERAAALAIYLKKENIDVAFTTPYKRTRQTIDSLVIPKVISYTEIPAMVELIKKTYLGKKIIIVGHSNTLMQIIEALGAKKPKDELAEDDYDYIFHLTLKGNKAKVKSDYYGNPHHL
ncbi:histidine phosphatase family protein [Pedobacter sp. AW1-32]|uniref:histidine phosphatase family protein n=1 Tax=Pedobacter sp. AW1-32 TaxID=3383026 RepID=UPI003FEF6A36